jgi:mannonate dehydratase
VPETIRVAIGVPSDATDDHLRFAAQVGCSGVVIQAPARVPGDRRWEAADLVRLRDWIEGFGLRLESIGVPHRFWMKVRLGEPGRDEELDEGWNARGRAYSTGYLMGLLRAVEDLA